MASRYWVGGTGNWDGATTTHWAATSGGAGGASFPGTGDDVYLDSNSGGGTITKTADSSCLGFFCNGDGTSTSYTGTYTGGAFRINVLGSVVIGTAMTVNNGIIAVNTIAGTPSITTNGISIGAAFIFASTAITVTLNDDIICTSSISVSSGTLDCNGKNIKCTTFSASGGTAKTVKSWGTIELTSTGTVWAAANATFTTPGLIKITDTSNTALTFAGGGFTYGNVWLARGASTAINTFSGSNTFADLKDTGTAAHTTRFTTGTTTTVTTFTVSGSAGNLITITSTTTGTHNLTKSGAGTISCDYLDIAHSIAAPGTTWYAGTHSVDHQATSSAGSGWIFTVPPAVSIPNKILSVNQAVNRAYRY